MPANSERVAVSSIRLDPENPRLPEELQGGSQERILEYFYDNGALEELARSFIDNGFFEHEPLLVVRADDSLAALEGNRRLAALKILLAEPEAEALGAEFDLGEIPAGRIAELRDVPTFMIDNRDEVRKY